MIEKLLKDVYDTVEAYYKENPDKTNEYNIFDVLGIAEKEVIMCRMLTDLLNPKGAHGRGAVFLEKFFEVVIGEEISKYDLKNAIVQKEHVIPGSTRRIDITIEMENVFIPIEVKIDAGEQPSQCYDYYQYTKNVKGIAAPTVYYLTKFGNMPSDKSTSRGNKKLNVEKDIKTLSFKNDIIRWLRSCIESEQSGIVKTVLEQYMNAIKEVTGTLNMELTEKIKDVLLSDSKSFRTALDIEKTLNSAKIELVEKVFEELEQQFDALIPNASYSFNKDKTWYYYNDCISEFFEKGKETFPGITYLLNDTKMYGGKQLILRIEISDYGIYSGFSLLKKFQNSGKCEELSSLSQSDKVNIQKYISVDHFDEDEIPFYSIYLPTGINGSDETDDNIPDFREMNEAAIKLVDKEYRRDFVEKSINVIQDKLLSLII